MGQEVAGEELGFKTKEFIPDDIFYVVFTFLSSFELRNVKLSSKRFYFLAQLVGSSFVYQSKKSFSRNPKIVEEIVKILTDEKNSKVFRRIILNSLHLQNPDLKNIFTCCPNIREVSLNYCTDLSWSVNSFCTDIAEFGRKLQKLHLLGVDLNKNGMIAISKIPLRSFSSNALSCGDSTREEGAYTFTLFEFFRNGEKASNLQSLEISFRQVRGRRNVPNSNLGSKNFFKMFPKGQYESLKKLILECYSNEENDDSQHISSIFPNLDQIEFLEEYDRYENKKMDVRILSNLPHSKLKHLRISRLGRGQGGGDWQDFQYFEPFSQLTDLIINCERNTYYSNLVITVQFSQLLNCKNTLRNLQIDYSRVKFGQHGSRKSDEELRHLIQFEKLQKVQISFSDVAKSQFNEFVVPFLTRQGKILRVLDISLPKLHTRDKVCEYDLSFIPHLVNVTSLGLKDIDDYGSECERVTKMLVDCSYKENSLSKLRELNLSGSRKMKKWMVSNLLASFKGLEELILFRTGLDPKKFFGLREKFKDTVIFVL